jgi:hypothetical protein
MSYFNIWVDHKVIRSSSFSNICQSKKRLENIKIPVRFSIDLTIIFEKETIDVGRQIQGLGKGIKKGIRYTKGSGGTKLDMRRKTSQIVKSSKSDPKNIAIMNKVIAYVTQEGKKFRNQANKKFLQILRTNYKTALAGFRNPYTKPPSGHLVNSLRVFSTKESRIGGGEKINYTSTSYVGPSVFYAIIYECGRKAVTPKEPFILDDEGKVKTKEVGGYSHIGGVYDFGGFRASQPSFASLHWNYSKSGRDPKMWRHQIWSPSSKKRVEGKHVIQKSLHKFNMWCYEAARKESVRIDAKVKQLLSSYQSKK